MKNNCKRASILVIVLLSVASAFSQTNCDYKKPHEADTWLFGLRGRIQFNQDPPAINPTTVDYQLRDGASAISDKEGNLLMFSNGMKIWDKSYNLMSNGDGLHGFSASTQSSIIVPHPGNSNKYFVFTIDFYYPGIPMMNNYGVNYSTVDFSSNNKGTVTSKNNLLFHENAQKVCAIKHENNEYYWVIFHGFGSNNGDKFYSYLVDTSGVVSTPVISVVGNIQTGDVNNSRGYMKASSDGTMIASTLPMDGVLEIFDFDKSTGEISNPRSSNTGDFATTYGIEFSPNQKYLYLTTSPGTSETGYCSLYQIDLESANPFSSATIIESFYFSNSLTDSIMNGLQLGVDGKIYLAKSDKSMLIGKPNLDMIYNPDRQGIACNFNHLNNQQNNGLFLEGGSSVNSLTDFITDYLNIPHFFYFNKCHYDTTDFEIRNTANLTPTWDFKDPTGESILVDEMKPRHIFSDPGTYQVELTEEYNGEEYHFNENIVINPLPDVNISQSPSDTIYILPNSSITLDAGSGYDIYNWNNGETAGQYYDVNNEGYYIVQVTDFNCCTNTDEVYIKYANLNFPNAIKPSSSNPDNQTFKVVGDISALAEYQLRVFNRWGQMIFETDDPTEGWDGNKDGDPAEFGTYVYSTVFTSFASNTQSSIEIKNTGTVTIIR